MRPLPRLDADNRAFWTGGKDNELRLLREQLTQRNKVALVLAPHLGLTAPTADTMAWWDRLNMQGKRTFGVGGVDAHAFKQRAPWGLSLIHI